MGSARRFGVVGAAVLAVAAGAFAAEDRLPRRELAPLEQALADAVNRVSNPAVLPMLGTTEACRGYRLPGFGALFVLAPRFVPERIAMRVPADSDLTRADRELSRSIADMEEKLRNATSADDRQMISNGLDRMKQRQQELRERAAAQLQLEREIQVFEAQVQSMRQESERAQREADQSMKVLSERLGSPHGTSGGVVAMSSHSVPPWLSWVRTPAEESRSPEQILSDVRAAIMDVLAKRGPDLQTLEPEEVVAVAVDFVRNPAVDGPQPPARTMVIRVPKKALDDRHAGKITEEEALKAFQIAEY